MRPLLCALACLALLSNSAAAQRKLNERRAIVPNGFVRIFTMTGSVTVIGWEKDSLVVTGTVWEPPGDRFAVGVTPKGAKMGLWSDLETNLKPSHITVHVPHRSQLWVKTTSANVRVSGVTGGIDLLSVSGALDVSGAPREVYAESMGGQITLNATTSAARLKTASGALRVNGSISDLTAVTVSGGIDVSASYQRARIESVDGDIRYRGALPPRSAIELTTHAGAIELSLHPATSAQFALNLYAGEFIDSFGITKDIASSGKQKAREVTFDIGKDPSARVTLRSFKGRTVLRKL